jgi:purine nucleosidase
MPSRINRLLSGLMGLILSLILAAAPADAEDGRRKVIIDDDNGFALMDLLLLESRDTDVLGMTTVSGDIWANRATAMALRGLEIAGRTDVPVIEGATYPLLNSEAMTDRWEALYGKLTWKGAWMNAWVEPTQQSAPAYRGPHDPVDLPWGNPGTKPLPEAAANFLIRMVHRYPGQVTIIACGPMTNLALAQRLDPEFAALARELVYMGGSLDPRQMLDNRPAAEFAREFENTPRREFNFRFDPEAASIVLRSPWRKIMAVPVDPSTATQLDKGLLDRMASSASPTLAAFLAKMQPGFPLWDEIAAAVWLDPTLVKDSAVLYLDADTQFGPGYGDMLSWRAGYQPGAGEQQATVVRSIDVSRMEALMVRLMANSAR